MPIYQIKIAVPKEKASEFLATVRTLSCDFNRNKGCLSFDVYQSVEKNNIYCIIGELISSKALKDHFRARNFEVLLGAARTLGEDFKLTIADNVETGDFNLAKLMLTAG